MATCDECGTYENLPYQCHRCGQSFCADHRLPENHDCPGLNEWNDPSGVFDSGFDGSVETSNGGRTVGSGGGGVAERVREGVRGATSTGGFMAYFRGNLTYLFLGLMWVAFLLQGLTRNVSPELARSLFVLRPTHLEYVWTWFTSIFAHGGFFHIALNSIVLYFFGPPVERRLGGRRFAALFLGAGAAAGLAQMLMGFYLGSVGPGVVGASGAIVAVMGALTVWNPNLRVYLYFLIPMPLWILTIGFAGLSLVMGFTGVQDGVAHFAHLAGLLIGLGYGKLKENEAGAPERLEFGGGGRGPGGPGGPGGRF